MSNRKIPKKTNAPSSVDNAAHTLQQDLHHKYNKVYKLGWSATRIHKHRRKLTQKRKAK